MKPWQRAIEDAEDLDILAESCWHAIEHLEQRPKVKVGWMNFEATFIKSRLENLARLAEKEAVETTYEEEGG